MTLQIEDSFIYTNCYFCTFDYYFGLSNYGSIHLRDGYFIRLTVILKRNHYKSNPLGFAYDGALFDFRTEKYGTDYYEEDSLYEDFGAM